VAVIHITEAEAAKDFASVLARVRAGAQVIIGDKSPAIVLHISSEHLVRRLSESLRLAKEHGLTVTLEGGFACDLEALVDSHPEPLHSAWD